MRVCSQRLRHRPSKTALRSASSSSGESASGSPSRRCCTPSWCCSSASVSTCYAPRNADLPRGLAAGDGPIDRRRHGRRRGGSRDRRRAREAGRGAQGRGGPQGGGVGRTRRGRSSTCRRRARRSAPTARKFVSEHDSTRRARDEEVRTLRGQRAAGRPRRERRRPRSRDPQGRRAAGDAHARSRPVPARRRASRAAGAHRRGRGNATARPIPDPPAAGRARSRARARRRARARAAAAPRRLGPGADADRAAAGARASAGDAGRAQGRRRRRRDGAQLEEVAVRLLLQPRQAPGRRALAPRGVYRQRDPTGDRSTAARTATPSCASSSSPTGGWATWRSTSRAGSSFSTTRRSRPSRRRRRFPTRRASSSRQRAHQLRLRLPVRPERSADHEVLPLLARSLDSAADGAGQCCARCGGPAAAAPSPPVLGLVRVVDPRRGARPRRSSPGLAVVKTRRVPSSASPVHSLRAAGNFEPIAPPPVPAPGPDDGVDLPAARSERRGDAEEGTRRFLAPASPGEFAEEGGARQRVYGPRGQGPVGRRPLTRRRTRNGRRCCSRSWTSRTRGCWSTVTTRSPGKPCVSRSRRGRSGRRRTSELEQAEQRLLSQEAEPQPLITPESLLRGPSRR